MYEEARRTLQIHFTYNGSLYSATGGKGAVYWYFSKDENDDIGSVNGFENVFTYKFIEGKSILDLFDEIKNSMVFE
ncbi:MAG: hypothetical protein K6G18_07475 [Treponema sp.]|nr:hypothetical protein [Treponema sp.]